VVGENYSVAAAGGTRVLVGQDAALLLVDLSDPQPRDGMRWRERIAAPAPVVSLALAADGSQGVGRLADDRIVAVRFDPLSMDEVGTGLVLEQPVDRGPIVSADPPAPRQAPPVEPAASPIAESLPPRPGPFASAPERVADRVPPDPPGAEEPSSIHRDGSPIEEPAADLPGSETVPAPPETAPTPEPVAGPRPASPPTPPAAEPETPRDSKPASAEVDIQVRGRIEGPAARLVEAVVLFGPDNLLREAKRVRPDADGRFRVSGLPPGRYGIQLDGGGSRMLVARPQSRTVEVASGSVAVADFHVLRAL
jgi:hypothetical protein